VKKWRFMSLLSLNLALWMDTLALAFPHHFLAIASISNVGKNISFMLSSASRASINLSFCKTNNMADIQGKSVSQFTASTLIGSGLGLGLSKIIDISSLASLYPCFLALTAVQAVTTHYSTKVVYEQYLNNSRANLLFNKFFESGRKDFEDWIVLNRSEVFWLPDFLNYQKCSFVQYGHNSVGYVLTHKEPDHAESMLH
jgi:hypothetical protein